MLTQEFATGADELRKATESTVTAVMCSESLWWRCHRRLLSELPDAGHDFEIRHIMHNASLREHRLTEGVRSVGDHVVYDQLSASVES